MIQPPHTMPHTHFTSRHAPRHRKDPAAIATKQFDGCFSAPYFISALPTRSGTVISASTTPGAYSSCQLCLPSWTTPSPSRTARYSSQTVAQSRRMRLLISQARASTWHLLADSRATRAHSPGASQPQDLSGGQALARGISLPASLRTHVFAQVTAAALAPDSFLPAGRFPFATVIGVSYAAACLSPRP